MPLECDVLPHASQDALMTVQAAIDIEQTDGIVAIIIDRLTAATSRRGL